MINSNVFPVFLIGKQTVFECRHMTEERLLDFYLEAFRLGEAAVPSCDMPVRRIAFEARIGDTVTLLFVGFQIEEPQTIPRDAVCWKVSDDALTILQPSAAGSSRQTLLPIQWQWKDIVSLHGRRWLFGDFTVPDLIVPGLIDSVGTKEVWISFNIFEDRTMGYGNGDQIELAPYDPQWPEQYQRFALWMKSYFGPNVIRRTEHFGSTAIEGMWAKPIIDILVEVPSFADARKCMLSRLSECWEYCWYNEHMMLIKRDSFMGKRTHHLHLAPAGHPLWERLSFRDYLRAHPSDAAAYGALKQQIVSKYHSDRERYTWSKSSFVREITQKALSWSKNRSRSV